MTCEKALELISGHIDGENTPAQEQALQTHLQQCPACRQLLDAWSAIDKNTAGLAQAAPEGLKKGVMYRIGQEAGTIPVKKRRWIGPGTGFGLVAAVLVLLVGLDVIPLRSRMKADEAAPAQAAMELPAPQETEAAMEAAGARAPMYDRSEAEAEFAPEDTGDDFEVLEGILAEEGESIFAAEPDVPVTEDDFYYGGGLSVSAGGSESPEASVRKPQTPEELRPDCQALSTELAAPVLLYTEFGPELIDLLSAQAPELGQRLEEADTAPWQEGYTVYTTDCQTVLAVQEWLLMNLPHSMDMTQEATAAESQLMIRFQELDPESRCLTTIITLDPDAPAVQWPDSWIAGWAQRLRLEENWALFFPTQDYTPSSDDPARLILCNGP